MKIACSYAGNYGKAFEAFVAEVDSSLFSGVELIPDQVPNLYSQLNPTRISQIKNLANRRGLSVLLHNVFYDINLVSLVPEVQDFAFKVTEEVFRIAQHLGAKSVTIHPGYMFPGWRSDPPQTERFWTSAEAAMGRLGRLGNSFGVRPLLENGSYYVTTANGSRPRPLHVGVTPEELRRLVAAGMSDVGVCLDFNKAIASERPLRDFIDQVGPSIDQLQASNVGGHEVEWSELITFMNVRGKEFWAVLEGPVANRQAQARLIADEW